MHSPMPSVFQVLRCISHMYPYHLNMPNSICGVRYNLIHKFKTSQLICSSHPIQS
uniref:Uncharacterized protein n=1 Tax=Rhizophora mucronata TaxID=61149 RepID=A0A2P2R2L8_RHIMU